MIENQLTEQIIGGAIEVHKHWGPGLYEDIYERSLCFEKRNQEDGYMSFHFLSPKRHSTNPILRIGVLNSWNLRVLFLWLGVVPQQRDGDDSVSPCLRGESFNALQFLREKGKSLFLTKGVIPYRNLSNIGEKVLTKPTTR